MKRPAPLAKLASVKVAGRLADKGEISSEHRRRQDQGAVS